MEDELWKIKIEQELLRLKENVRRKDEKLLRLEQKNNDLENKISKLQAYASSEINDDLPGNDYILANVVTGVSCSVALQI